MSTTLANINSLINDKRRDTSNDAVDMTAEGFRAINSTLQIWQQQHDWPWTITSSNIDYNEGITRYAVPADYKAAIDLKPYRIPRSVEFTYTSPNSFDSDTIRTKRFTIEQTDQTENIRIKYAGDSAFVHALTSYDSDGLWVASGDASAISSNTYDWYDLGGSTRFTAAAGTSMVLTNSTMPSKDFSKYEDRSNLYLNIELPDVTNFTSVSLKWGTDASNYYTSTSTTDYLGDSAIAGWNKMKFGWAAATEVGSPDASDITYAVITVAYGAGVTGTFRVENLFISENVPLTMKYYSTNMITDISAGDKLQIFNDAAATGDTPLWTGKWDMITETFVSSVMETIFWITGEYNDKALSESNIQKLIGPMKQQFPTRRRRVELLITADINKK